MKTNYKYIFIALLFYTVILANEAHAQLIKTSLTVTVRDDLGNTVKGASVMLFEQEADYLVEKNSAAEGITDDKGIVKFKNLKAMPYYVLARTDEKDNAGGGEQTGKLEEKKFNKVTIVIQ
ncbi:MAG: carboxypeptidase regulatory-like domain-containing protein [Bacteroidia bacterium]|nr:carboxypeptidase regulatory-like domain-containing protein [Bacteroidia bacterium]